MGGAILDPNKVAAGAINESRLVHEVSSYSYRNFALIYSHQPGEADLGSQCSIDGRVADCD